MSLILEKSDPKVWVKTFDHRVVNLTHCDEHSEISMSDFCDMVRYVLTNTSLGPGDPRCGLVEEIKHTRTDTGFGGRGQRYLLPGDDV